MILNGTCIGLFKLITISRGEQALFNMINICLHSEDIIGKPHPLDTPLLYHIGSEALKGSDSDSR